LSWIRAAERRRVPSWLTTSIFSVIYQASNSVAVNAPECGRVVAGRGKQFAEGHPIGIGINQLGNLFHQGGDPFFLAGSSKPNPKLNSPRPGGECRKGSCD
jgi:hypothetical protein